MKKKESFQQADQTQKTKINNLYTPQLERDSCGVGMIADLGGEGSNSLVEGALTILENMEHRGASGYEETTGDGAGILVQIPDAFFRKVLKPSSPKLPKKGHYAVGMFFLPYAPEQYLPIIDQVKQCIRSQGFNPFFVRSVPIQTAGIGDSALSAQPAILQIFLSPQEQMPPLEEEQLFLLRHFLDRKFGHIREYYCCSLSSRTIIYKGMLTALQLRTFFPDLSHPDFASALAIVHSRFSTNTLPNWKLAQPFHHLAHNGEINTLQGNLNWWTAREKQMLQNGSPELKKWTDLFPLTQSALSDSGNLNQVVGFLGHTFQSLAKAIMVLIPEAWQNDRSMAPEKRAFYQYFDGLFEPWDGPASICFTDGHMIGATLDRNGLRPSRYLVTKDNWLILGSEAGALPVEPDHILAKGRLQPGKMLLVDLQQHRIIPDEELKTRLSREHNYQAWLRDYSLELEEIPNHSETLYEPTPLAQRQVAAGFTKEDQEVLLKAMVTTQKEAIGSMGSDIPLAVLSNTAQHLSNYFKQQFAQVTNPPIDPLREGFFMSLSTALGAGSKIAQLGPRQATVLRTHSPLLTQDELGRLLSPPLEEFPGLRLSLLHPVEQSFEQSLDELQKTLLLRIQEGYRHIVLSDRGLTKQTLALPSLLVIGAIHHFLIEQGLRKEVILTLEVADCWETHHLASLLSFGADLVCPYLAYETVEKLSQQHRLSPENGLRRYRKAMLGGLLKIMSKLGISTLASYKGAQTFEALGIHSAVIERCFKGTISRIGGLGFAEIQKEQQIKQRAAFQQEWVQLPDLGVLRWQKRGEYHLFNPQTIHLLQFATKSNSYAMYQQFAQEIDNLEKNNSTLRSFLRLRPGKAIPIEEVEPADAILKRFATGAMSFGSISPEAHSLLARAMHRIGGKSNSGEGGEDPRRAYQKIEGDSLRSAIKQVASGRFGVDLPYLISADELQIKIAQGAKPGEGGHLPGHKVNPMIAKVRNSTPGVGLISPPPHHDIYSIEDLAQLIYDLKQANERARISVKLVAKAGVGIIAAGVAKAKANHLLISGFDGGTGASPLSSIRHAGIPWEIGLAETHQTLMRNGLRDRVVLQTDGQIRTGRDMAIATILGAEEWGIATAALVVEGCILMRKCHLNTCPVGIATQDEDLRKKFAGKVEDLVHYFQFLAQHLREIMASVGVRTVNELVGRTDLLEIDRSRTNWKTQQLDLTPLLVPAENPYQIGRVGPAELSTSLSAPLDEQLMERLSNPSTPNLPIFIQNTDRAVGTRLSGYLLQKRGSSLSLDQRSFYFRGSAGQSFGAFTPQGLQFHLEGEANDYLGKGLSGATLTVRPDRNSTFRAHEQVISGNVALYGATAGFAYINGRVGDRFAVRNSGATAVVEGVGTQGCEYMTGGIVAILGTIGQNFAAGMSGGLVYLYNPGATSLEYINKEMVYIEPLDKRDEEALEILLRRHQEYTQSARAKSILHTWNQSKGRFLRVVPKEYKAILEKRPTRSLGLLLNA
ncbi:MAG: glutamate synthase large subunit [Bacteroidota bacterium]